MYFALLSLLTFAVLPAAPKEPSTGDVTEVIQQELAKLPGHTGMVFTELTPKGPQVLFGVRQDERFAVGSSFKLFILGTLIDEVNNDRRSRDDIMRLRADLKGPPHSEMAEWPVGSPVTLSTLSLKMISISDNTATDHLLYLLGRERIEEQMTRMGDRNADWNRPLLSTREMTMLRDKKTGMLGNQYRKLDDAARRKFLADHFQGELDYDAVDFDTGAYDVAEWYATPLDMSYALDWIRNHTQDGMPASQLRQVLTLDKKLQYDQDTWPFVGFKGGSEDQLLAGNWLLKNKNGKWYTFDLFYNDPDGKADQQQAIGVIQGVFRVIENSIQ